MSGFKSEEHKLKMYQLYAEGKVKKETIEKWEAMTPKTTKLPQRIGPKQKLIKPSKLKK